MDWTGLPPGNDIVISQGMGNVNGVVPVPAVAGLAPNS